MAGGKNSDKAAVLVRISKRTLQAIDKIAKRNSRSRNGEIVVALSRYLDRETVQPRV